MQTLKTLNGFRLAEKNSIVHFETSINFKFMSDDYIQLVVVNTDYETKNNARRIQNLPINYGRTKHALKHTKLRDLTPIDPTTNPMEI